MNTKNQYLLLFSGSEWYNQLSAAEIQNVIDQSKAWFERLATAGKVKGSQALDRNGATIIGKSGRVISDGPFAEAKEVVGGFSIMEFKTREEALANAREFMELHRKHWPEFEGECEVRPFEAGPPPA